MEAWVGYDFKRVLIIKIFTLLHPLFVPGGGLHVMPAERSLLGLLPPWLVHTHFTRMESSF